MPAVTFNVLNKGMTRDQLAELLPNARIISGAFYSPETDCTVHVPQWIEVNNDEECTLAELLGFPRARFGST